MLDQWLRPILDRAGRPVAIAEADAGVSRYLERPRAELLLGFAIGGRAFLVAMIAGLPLARNITRGLNKLSISGPFPARRRADRSGFPDTTPLRCGHRRITGSFFVIRLI